MRHQTRRRKLTRRRRQRGGNRNLKLFALLALPGIAKSQGLYELASKWWDEGGVANSRAFADAIVAAAESIPGAISASADEIIKELKTLSETEKAEILSQVPKPEPGYTSSAVTPSVEPTELPPALPVVPKAENVQVGETYMFVPKDGGETVIAMIMDHTTSGKWQSIPEISPSKWADYTVYGPMKKEDDEDFGGKRRKPRRKTIRRKK